MATFKKTMIAASLGLSGLAALPAQAVVFLPGLSEIELINRENIYRLANSCTTANPCLPYNSNLDPVGYQRPDPAFGNNVLTGDLFIGVYASRSVTLKTPSDVTTWSQDNTAPGFDNFTGYFVQEVNSIALNVIGALDRVLLGTPTVADPFGILNTGAGESAAWFVDNTGYTLDGAVLTVQSSITQATDGVLWAKLGIGAPVGTAAVPSVDADGYVYSEVEIGGGLANFATGDFYVAYNLLTKGPAYNAGLLTGINDPAEGLFGGLLAGDTATTVLNNRAGVCVPTATFACNDLVGNGQLSVNQNFSFGTSPWQFASEDPLQLYRVPEPTTLALLGLGLMGVAGVARRSRRA